MIIRISIVRIKIILFSNKSSNLSKKLSLSMKMNEFRLFISSIFGSLSLIVTLDSKSFSASKSSKCVFAIAVFLEIKAKVLYSRSIASSLFTISSALKSSPSLDIRPHSRASSTFLSIDLNLSKSEKLFASLKSSSSKSKPLNFKTSVKA